jgi:hypothetical protein
MDGTVYRGLNYSIPMNDVENMSIYKNDTDNTKIQNILISPEKPILTCSEEITRIEATIPKLQNRLVKLKKNCNISGGNQLPKIDYGAVKYDEIMKEKEEEEKKKIEEELNKKFNEHQKIVKKTFDEYKKHNMWEIELVVQNKNIVKMKITEGIDEPKVNGKSLNIIKECEESCVLGSISKNVPKKNSTCKSTLKKVKENVEAYEPFIKTAIKAETSIQPNAPIHNISKEANAPFAEGDDDRDSTLSNSDMDFSGHFKIKPEGGLEHAKPPSLFSRLFGTRKKVHPERGGKKKHRKTNKKHRSRKSRR